MGRGGGGTDKREVENGKKNTRRQNVSQQINERDSNNQYCQYLLEVAEPFLCLSVLRDVLVPHGSLGAPLEVLLADLELLRQSPGSFRGGEGAGGGGVTAWTFFSLDKVGTHRKLHAPEIFHFTGEEGGRGTDLMICVREGTDEPRCFHSLTRGLCVCVCVPCGKRVGVPGEKNIPVPM